MIDIIIRAFWLKHLVKCKVFVFTNTVQLFSVVDVDIEMSGWALFSVFGGLIRQKTQTFPRRSCLSSNNVLRVCTALESFLRRSAAFSELCTWPSWWRNRDPSLHIWSSDSFSSCSWLTCTFRFPILLSNVLRIFSDCISFSFTFLLSSEWHWRVEFSCSEISAISVNFEVSNCFRVVERSSMRFVAARFFWIKRLVFLSF